MTDVIFDPPRDDQAWRKTVYDGDIIILSSTTEMLALLEPERGMILDAFAPLDPQRARESFTAVADQWLRPSDLAGLSTADLVICSPF